MPRRKLFQVLLMGFIINVNQWMLHCPRQNKLQVQPADLIRHLQLTEGSLLWLVIRTRPDMAWACSRVAS
eukprot:3402932-Amphidinium_carterae.1